MPSPQALAAATWWADILRGPPDHDNGEAFQSAFANMASRMAAAKYPRTEEDILRFRDILAERIDKDLAHRQVVFVNVDYHPCRLLWDAAQDAKVPGLSDMFTFPFKTAMRVSAEKVEVSSGYCAPYKEIWNA